jgi:hypothetical protein
MHLRVAQANPSRAREQAVAWDISIGRGKPIEAEPGSGRR